MRKKEEEEEEGETVIARCVLAFPMQIHSPFWLHLFAHLFISSVPVGKQNISSSLFFSLSLFFRLKKYMLTVRGCEWVWNTFMLKYHFRSRNTQITKKKKTWCRPYSDEQLTLLLHQANSRNVGTFSVPRLQVRSRGAYCALWRPPHYAKEERRMASDDIRIQKGDRLQAGGHILVSMRIGSFIVLTNIQFVRTRGT